MVAPQLPDDTPLLALSARMRNARPQSAGGASRRPSSARSGPQSRPRSAAPTPREEKRWECPAPRAMRPSSACSSVGSARRRNGPTMGDSPWSAYIGGGIHNSYTAIGQPQARQHLAHPARSARSTPVAPAMPGFEEMVDINSAAHGLLDARGANKLVQFTADGPNEETEKKETKETERRLTLCPYMRNKGYCRLPSCPYIHEVCRPKKEFEPLYLANAPRHCYEVPCRFFSVLGMCPHGENCAYLHDVKYGPCPPPSALLAAAIERRPEVVQEPVQDKAATDPEATIRPEEAAYADERRGSKGSMRTSSTASSVPGKPRPKSAGSSRPHSARRVPTPQKGQQKQRPPSAKKPLLADIGFLGFPPDLGTPSKQKMLSGRVAVLDMLSNRTVTGTA
eukprot:TRINITY_DN79669_c0_g1_i1.p1 TRINITY_DN79669_c0_g1~~TRINITY_DN79669_c0_g1_i1.p1  ORF type:complete len:406 (-),score=43.86 TRINITY_DN79669_c0_g1_i1:120-1304(-)